ncbi:RdlA protein [Streptomyces adustus]|uniref:RdlA protein n=1 Tax=Streptomyces adustus TaxID=1609272 RepID=A0A5N8VR31_9ACTN|nr:rodlin [Streptomyces adustus]MPY37753.1 RdlA protein [Streptomyces adustus]
MLKKAMAAAAIAASVVGASAAVAPQALATGNDGTHSASGNLAVSQFGNSVTKGSMSPQATLVQGSLNKLCVGLPAKANVGPVLGVLLPIAAQDLNVLSSPQNQQCAENSTQAKGDEPLSHIVDDIPVLAHNGVGNH